MSYFRKTIPLNHLLLDPQNARHGNLEDQTAALKWMVSQQKVMTLAQSIAENGLSPSELPIVIPTGDDQKELYTVVEGNRRTTALKLLLDPDLCPDERARQRFSKLSQNSKVTLPQALECVVFPNLESAGQWIKLRHAGEQEGAGTVPWGAKELEFFAKRLGDRGPNEASMRLLDYAKGKNLISSGEFGKIPLTNVTRLVSSPDVRRELGMNLRKGEPTRVADVEYFDTALGSVLRSLASGDWTVSKLKNLEQRENFIRTVKDKDKWGSYQVREEAPLKADEGQPRADQEEVDSKLDDSNREKQKRTSRDSLTRPTAISSSCAMKIDNRKALKMFRELKSLDVNEFPNAAAVLTRVFIEVCVDLYLEKHSARGTNQGKLYEKIRWVREHIVRSNPENEWVAQDLRGLEVLSQNNAQNIVSVRTFNDAVHNPKFIITSRELKETWDRLEPCLKWFQGHV